MPRLKTLTPRLKMLETRITPIEHHWHKFYYSKEWIELVKGLIQRRGPRCEKCGKTNCVISGDHIIEILDGGEMLEESNIQLLCGQCHTQKTLDNRKKRAGMVY